MKGERGSIAVEAAVTLPLVVLLTLGGLSVLWWLHNKAMMHLVVYEAARERAGDANWTGFYKDARDTIQGPKETYQLPNFRFASFHLPLDPPMVMAAGCNVPEGRVPMPPAMSGVRTSSPDRTKGGLLAPVRDAREVLEDLVDDVQGVEDALDGIADEAVTTAERLVWYRRVLDNLRSQRANRQRQAIDYIVGGVLELAVQYPCSSQANGGVILAAKAVIQGERAYPQR